MRQVLIRQEGLPFLGTKESTVIQTQLSSVGAMLLLGLPSKGGVGQLLKKFKVWITCISRNPGSMHET